MIKINPSDLNKKDNYKLLSASVVPRPIAFVTTLNSDNSVNGAPFSFFNVLTAEPPMVSISILRKDRGKMKDTARNIIKNKEFVVHITTLKNIDKINMTAALLDENISEVDLAGLTKIKSDLIKTPGVLESDIRFEVKLINHLELGINNNISSDLIIGEVIKYHISPDVYKDTYINYDELKPIGRLAGNNFMTTKGFRKIIRPK